MSISAPAQPGIPEWFAGKDVLVTGATGFMGKVLLEKLLRCCPETRRIYIVVRPKRGALAASRAQAMAKLPLFESLLKKNPLAFDKVVPLEGQVNDPDMGLSPADQQLIVDNVAIVFHLAASLDWRASMKRSLQHNAIGTKNVLEFCSRIKKLESLLYTSTAFCQCDQEVLEERAYPPNVDIDMVLEMGVKLDEEAMESLRPALIGNHPNCYTFTKALAEALVARYSETMPVSIVRPSIVVPAFREPLPGWVDTMNGPIGVLVAAGKGVLRSMMCNEKYNAECIPADACINVIIAAAHKRTKLPRSLPEPPVYNASAGDVDHTTWSEILAIGRSKIIKYPFEWAIWYPDGSIRTNWYTHQLIVFFFQTLPAYIVDFIFLCLFMERFMVRAQRKIISGMELLTFFTMRRWIFRNQNAWALWPELNDKDKETFYINSILPLDKDAFMDSAVFGARTYCMKESPATLKQCRRRLRVQYVIHRVCVALFYMYVAYLVVRVLGIFIPVPAVFSPTSILQTAGRVREI